ncbi:Amino acid/polyamine transporter I [Lasiodiplodia theobromae]|uniref:Amino-acid permease C15C4.04c n=1 Tax=Lasiodiplodia hormozganensis TaxID=869390 RepID=A0AA39Y307_9PEZI|nr:Amino acid/polyamine transporter I [Lasiodiplodia theobromae]KAF4535691.1 Amino acid/polyamine transporter I [Lasiodiplodia theobromae]KAF9634389.1 Amino acid/polyamine transporter I [Lasiodiplodia theobromae]KAK0645076.1 putative amino-acid permease C15C4.04c [Lasiodiplodia hormozganensis]
MDPAASGSGIGPSPHPPPPGKAPDSDARRVMASIQNDDERLLARIGYNQELRREFNKWSTVSYAISILGVLGSVPATFGSPIAAGGPATAVWAWFIGSVMAMCIASSVAELVSAYPTAGGMYFVTKHVVPPEHVAIWAWVIGWCNFLGQAAGVASLAYTISQMIFAAAVMNATAEDGSSSFTPSALQTVLLAILILCLFGIICSLTTRALHKIILWFAPINILASISICVALLVLTPNKRSAEWVFTEVTDGSGWGSKGFSFLLGFLSVAWTMTDYDGTTHMSEETHDAAIRGPVAIRSAILVSGLTGWMLTVTFCFCLTDYDGIVNSPTGLPVAQIFLNAGGRAGGTVMWFFVILVQFFTGCSAMLANARMCYAFARDDALPFSSFWSTINKYTGTPVNAVWLVVVFCTCLDLIGIGSTLTIVAIFNVCAPALDLSYVAVIIAHRVYEKRVQFIPGPYTMGIWSKPINLVACTWVVFISVILFFPTTKPVTATNMNYAICVAGFVGLFSLSWWWIGARKKYTGPRTKDIIDMLPTDDPDEENFP